MKLEQSFEVSAPLQRVWEALIDVERVAPCLPGAAVTGRNDDGSYNGEFKVKIGPTSAAYAGKLKMESVDEQAHHATMQAAGTDKRGQGGAKATIESSVEAVNDDTSQVNVSTDYHITGRLARFGRGGMIEEISNRLLREFATRLQAMLADDGSAGEDAAGAADDGSATAAAAAAQDESGAPRATDSEATAADAPDTAPNADAADTAVAAQAGSEGEPDAPDHAIEATAETPGQQATSAAGADDPFAPPVAPAPPSGAAAGTAPPPPPAPPLPPPADAPPQDNEPMQGLSLVGGALVSQVKNNPLPFAAALVGLLVLLGLVGRRARG